MAITKELRELVNRLPDPDKRGMYTENMDKQEIESTAAELARGGKENLLGLIELLGEPGHPDNVKPHYALHCVMNHTLVAGNEVMRKAFCEVLASQLDNDQLTAYNRSYLCQELQWAGRDEACPALGDALLHEETTDAAAMALTAIGGERAASALRSAVEKAQGRSRLNVIHALAALGDRHSAATFKSALQDKDPDTRMAASIGWAKLGQPGASQSLLKAADQSSGWERSQLTKSCLVQAESLAAAGHQAEARQIYQHLQKTRTAPREAHIQEATRRGLASLA